MAEPAIHVDFELDPALDDDARRVLVELWTDVTNAGGAVGFVPPVTPADVGGVAARALDLVASGGDHIVVAWIGDEPVGFAFLAHRPGPLFRHWATIKRLQVHPSLQGLGIGAALLDATHDVARRLGLEALHLTVRGGTGTERFYVGRGYEVVATIPGVIRLEPGDDRDEIYLVVHL